MNPNMDLNISDADLERMEAEAAKDHKPQAKAELELGDEELDFPELSC